MKNQFMSEAIRLSRVKMQAGQGGPFGAVLVRRGQIIARGWNQVLASNDPTAHAEVMAIRAACRKLRRFHLADCELYTSCEPCPMCLAAIYWAQLRRVYFANTRRDAARIGFSDDLIYREISRPLSKRRIPMRPLMRAEAAQAFQAWADKADKIGY